MYMRMFLPSLWLGACFGANIPTASISSNDIAAIPLLESAASVMQIDTSMGYDANKFNKIIGGSNALPGDAPWQVYLEYTQDQHYRLCGGTLLSNRVVVTAAHCIKGSTEIDVGVGNLDRTQFTEEQVFGVKTSYVHEDYKYTGKKPFDLSNDIALLILDRNVTLDPDTVTKPMVRVANLPPSGRPDSDYTGKKALVSGWGVMNQTSSSLPNKLQKLEVEIFAQTVCKTSYELPDWVYSEQKMMCAGTTNYDKDACQGDSGGPLVYKVKAANILWGIVSYGDGCAQKPGGYTKVTNYVDWIKEKAKAGGYPIPTAM